MNRLIVVALALLTLALVGCSSSESESTQTQSDGYNKPAGTPKTTAQAASVNNSGIQFSSYDIDGNLRDASEWFGSTPVVVNIWGTWCPPCRKEIPDLVKVYEEFRYKGVEMIGVAIARGSRGGVSDVRPFVAQHGMDWTHMMLNPNDPGMMSVFAPRSVPTTIFYDRDGNEVKRLVGAHDYYQFKEAFEAIL